jgi:hypothetical protein
MFIRYSIHKFKNEPIREKILIILYFLSILFGIIAFVQMLFARDSNYLTSNSALHLFIGPFVTYIVFTAVGIIPLDDDNYLVFYNNVRNLRQKVGIYMSFQLLCALLILQEGWLAPSVGTFFTCTIPTALIILNFYFSNSRDSINRIRLLEQKIDDLTDQLKNKN